MSTYKNKAFDLPEQKADDENYRIIKRLLTFSQQQ